MKIGIRVLKINLWKLESWKLFEDGILNNYLKMRF